MGTDLDLYKSHPDKLLEVHIMGVLQKAQKRTKLPLAELSVLIHDLGKINPNFQAKLDPDKKDKYLGYSHHSYLSVLAFLCYLTKNQAAFRAFIGAVDSTQLRLEIVRIVAIVAHHHGHLPNFSTILKQNEIDSLTEFINSLERKLPISAFYEQRLQQVHIPFELTADERLWRPVNFEPDNVAPRWQSNALIHFLETQFSFAALIEADKRDAGYNESYYCEDHNANDSEKLRNALHSKFGSLIPTSELDRLRTAIRLDALAGLQTGLANGHRIFTLASPTGSGKTFTLLSLASAIQEVFPEMSILYALPFLSITDQVEGICLKDLSLDILTVNSKSISERIEQLQKELENNPSDEKLKELLAEIFKNQTFDHPFILTTFVQFFETLMSNRNATLLKLPNFSNRIVLIDEVQALPPRLYIFFTAWLDAFCRMHNSYAILSTATMPNFSLITKHFVPAEKRADLLFKDFQMPFSLIKPEPYFEVDTFNRYQISLINEDQFTIEDLAVHVKNQNQSCLVIVNTIRDSRELFNELSCERNTYLLNTHFLPVDRREKIKIIKQHLADGEKVILISTQLIEAGVDVDFPVVYRDLCPLPSLIQSAGRCNRNKKLKGTDGDFALGQVFFFHLTNSKGKSSAEQVYQKEASQFLQFSREKLTDGVQEKHLYSIQAEFFKWIANNLSIGETNQGFNLVECVNKAEFETLGRFQLIEKMFGYEFRYYIPINEQDKAYEEAVKIMFKMVKAEGYAENRRYKSKLESQLKRMADRIITIRVFDKKDAPQPANETEYFDLRVLLDLGLYTFEKGLSMEDAIL